MYAIRLTAEQLRKLHRAMIEATLQVNIIPKEMVAHYERSGWTMIAWSRDIKQHHSYLYMRGDVKKGE